MTELQHILKKYLISVIIIVFTTLVLCALFIAKDNTNTMLFG